MADFKIGDRVKVKADDEIGTIVAKGIQSRDRAEDVIVGKELKSEPSICFWEVRLDRKDPDGKDIVKYFADEELEKLI